MTTFRVTELLQSGVLYLYSSRDEIQIDPDYQRMGEIWTIDKRQLLIDSILNDFDIPKFYFHELSKGPASKKYKYAIIDGRQRLESIWSFIDGDFTLANDFRYLNDPDAKPEGLTYRELGRKYPRLKARFDATSLSVVIVQTDDLDLIDEMFSRLNEAVPLNAAEKRNAFGGRMPIVIRNVVNRRFFRNRIRISNKRYQHLDLAAKFLYLESQGGVADTKKVYIDHFVKEYKAKSLPKVKRLVDDVINVLSAMDKVFIINDKLLQSAGTVVLYFLLFRDGLNEGSVSELSRSKLISFETKRKKNRAIAENDISKANYALLEFDRLTQTPNDAYAIRFRLQTLKEFLGFGAKAAVKKKA